MKDGRGDRNDEVRSHSAIYNLYCPRVVRRARAACYSALHKARCETYVVRGYGPGPGSLANDAQKDDRLRLENGR